MPYNSPSPENLTIGKGILYVALWSGGSPGSYEDMGECSSLTIEPSIEKLPFYSSRQAARVKVKDPVIQTDYALTIELNETSAKNLNRFLMGSISGNNIIYGLQETTNEYAVKFVSDNTLGPEYTWEFWKCSLSPGGALSLIGDEYMAMTLNAEGLADTALHPTSPYFTVTGVTTTTTTTTS